MIGAIIGDIVGSVVTVSETRMGRPRYTEFMTLPSGTELLFRGTETGSITAENCSVSELICSSPWGR